MCKKTEKDLIMWLPYNGKFSHRKFFTEFGSQYQFAKIKIRKTFSYFWQISVED